MLSSRLSADALGSIDMTEHEVRFLSNIDDDRERSPTPLLIGGDLAESAPVSASGFGNGCDGSSKVAA
jgi:hypothetical protein